jgi:hypothetical protein
MQSASEQDEGDQAYYEQQHEATRASPVCIQNGSARRNKQHNDGEG